MCRPVDYSYCAGVLPYTEFNHTIYFLMGKSRRHGRLITFSGKNDHIDTEIEETAAREFFEETLGSVMDKQTALMHIRKTNITLHSRTPRGMPCYTYMIQIPFKKLYAVVFHKTRDFLSEINMRAPEFNEMCDIKWVCSRSMLDRVRKQWERHGLLTCQHEWEKIELLCKRPSADISPWRDRQLNINRNEDTPLNEDDIDVDVN